MKPGDLVRITPDNGLHGGKIALITGMEVSAYFDPVMYQNREDIVFEILLEGKLRRGVSDRWLEVISEAG
jgi:hypothetical protein